MRLLPLTATISRPATDTELTQSLEAVAALVTVLVPLATVIVLIARSSDRFRCWRLAAAFRRPLRYRRRRSTHDLEPLFVDTIGVFLPAGTALLSQYRPQWRRRRWAAAALSREVRYAIDGNDVLPVDVVSRLLANPGLTLPTQGWVELAGPLERLFRAASTTTAQGLLARILYPEDVAASRAVTRAIAEHLRRFSTARIVDPSKLRLSEEERERLAKDGINTPSFGGFVTALSGAVVLSESVETRSRYLDDVLVWHSRRFHSVADHGSTYESAHRGGEPCDLAELDTVQRKAGDFDRRVLTLRSVAVVTSPSVGRVNLVLETDETCYLTTEQGDATGGSEAHVDTSRGLAPDGSAAPATSAATPSAPPEPIGCKHLLPRPGPSTGFAFETADMQGPAGVRGVKRVHSDAQPVVLITSYVSLLSSDDHLVLVKRTGKVRHGQDVISATAGGIVEPDGDGATGDVDPAGMPSPLHGVLRESAEEIGTSIPDGAPQPVCVFLANARNLGAIGTDARAGRGQLVATVLYLCRVARRFEALTSDLELADPSLGAFEVDHLVNLKLKPDDELRAKARELGIAEMKGAPAAFALAVQASARAGELDQHGLLSMLYTAAVLDGAEAAIRCFTAAFDERPWWAIPAGAGACVHPRVVRDPRELSVGPSTAEGGRDRDRAPLDTYVNRSGWVTAWSELSHDLSDARSAMTRGHHTSQRGGARSA